MKYRKLAKLCWTSVFSCFLTLASASDSYAPDVRLSGDIVTFPLEVVKGFPFLDGEVNGIKGKLMLDTGGMDAVDLNNHMIHFRDAKTIGVSFYASGQNYEERLTPLVDELRIGGLAIHDAHEVRVSDHSQLEHIAPDFLGFVGFDFFSQYAMKLDYANSRVDFFKSRVGKQTAAIHGETLVATLSYETHARLNDPAIKIKLGSVDFLAVFDTGQYGSLYTDSATLSELLRQGVLKPNASEPGEATYDITSMSVGSCSLAVPRVEAHNDEFRPAKAMGLTDKNILTVGYGLLSQFKTVWDFPNKKIYILMR